MAGVMPTIDRFFPTAVTYTLYSRRRWGVTGWRAQVIDRQVCQDVGDCEHVHRTADSAMACARRMLVKILDGETLVVYRDTVPHTQGA